MKKIDEAIIFATNAHSGQKRKIANTEYIWHPLEVAIIINTLTDDEDIMIAGLLHDVVEDCKVDPNVILEKFGKKVYDLVMIETENKHEEMSAEDSWMIRKKESLEKLKNETNINSKLMWLADKLSNIRSIYKGYLKEGNNVWNHFHQKDINMQKWYYTEVVEALKDLENTYAYRELCVLIDRIFNGDNNG